MRSFIIMFDGGTTLISQKRWPSAFKPYEAGTVPTLERPEKRRAVDLRQNTFLEVEDGRSEEDLKRRAISRYAASGPFETEGMKPEFSPREALLLEMERLRAPTNQTSELVRRAVETYERHWNAFRDDNDGSVSPNTMIKATRIVDQFLRIEADKQNMSSDMWGHFGDLFEGARDCSAVLGKITGERFNSLRDVRVFTVTNSSRKAVSRLSLPERQEVFAKYRSISNYVTDLLPQPLADNLKSTFW